MIYTASKVVHADKWKKLRAEGWPVISTWIDEAGVGQTADFADLWKRCANEAAKASVTLLYREPGEILKGAFVEAGVAMASCKPVFAIGCAEFSFVNHPLVRQFDDLPSALEALAALSSTAGETIGGGELREVGWLIERKFPVNSIGATEPRWYAQNEDDGWHWWAATASEAKRFASKAEAEAYLAYQMIASDPTINITEHVWFNDGFSWTHGRALASPPPVEPAKTFVRCIGCDGYGCVDSCDYPGAAGEPVQGVTEALTYGQTLIAEAIQAHFGDRVDDYDEDVDDTSNHDAWEAFDALTAEVSLSKLRSDNDEYLTELGRVIMACPPGMRTSPASDGVKQLRSAFERATALAQPEAPASLGKEGLSVMDAAADLLASLDPDALNPEQFNAWCALTAALAPGSASLADDTMQGEKK